MRRLCAVLVLVAMVAAACTGGDDEASPEPEPSAEPSAGTSPSVAADLVGTWTESGEPLTTPPGSGGEVMLELNAGGQGTSYDGCNGGGGAWSLEGNMVVLTDWFTTLRGCPPSVRTAVIGGQQPVKVVGNTLVVPAEDGGEPFVLQRVEA